MPQPLSRIKPNASVYIGNVGDYPLRRHPDLAVLAMECIRSWSDVENFMLHLYVELMGGNASLIAKTYLNLRGASNKQQLLVAAAEASLDDKLKPLFKAIFSRISTHEKDRDKIAHWTWGDSPQLPDALLLMDPRAKLEGPLNMDQIFVYREGDFLRIIAQNEKLAGAGMAFEWILSGHPANRGDAIFQQLCKEFGI